MALKGLMSAANRDNESQSVIAQLESDKDFESASVLLAYWPLDDELNLRPLINKWRDAKRILLPRIVGKQLVLIEFKGEETLVSEHRFGIMEPTGPSFIEYEKIELVLVPGMAFDAQGFRLGRGGGYYDRLLPRLCRARKIGVGFSFQLVSKVPCEPHDEVLDKVYVSG